MVKRIRLQIIIKRLDRIEIKLTKMNKGIKPQHTLENILNINKSGHDVIGDTLLRIEKDLKYVNNIDNIDNIDNYQRYL